MIVNIYVTIDPKGDRPYVSTNPPKDLDRSKGVTVHLVEARIPDSVPIDSVQQVEATNV